MVKLVKRLIYGGLMDMILTTVKWLLKENYNWLVDGVCTHANVHEKLIAFGPTHESQQKPAHLFK